MEISQLINDLKDLVGNERVIVDKEIIQTASKDYIGFRRYERADGKFYVPKGSCVIKASSTEDISKVLKYLNEHKVDIVPRTGDHRLH